MIQRTTKVAFVAALAAAVLAGMTGCGGDDDKGGGGAGCSSCPADARQACSDGVSECTQQGSSASQCQQAAEQFCALLSGDGGLDLGDGG